MSADDPRYMEVEQLWKLADVPPITMAQAAKLERLVLKRFGSLEDFPASPYSRLVRRASAKAATEKGCN